MESLGNRFIFKEGFGILGPVLSFLGRLWVLIMALVLLTFYLFWPLLHPFDYGIDLFLGGSALLTLVLSTEHSLGCFGSV